MNTHEWIPCTNWKDVPVGTYLVKLQGCKGKVDEYHTATVHKNVVVVGGHFAFDMGPLIAYRTFEPYSTIKPVVSGRG